MTCGGGSEAEGLSFIQWAYRWHKLDFLIFMIILIFVGDGRKGWEAETEWFQSECYLGAWWKIPEESISIMLKIKATCTQWRRPLVAGM